jgi:RND family efflux transporter MFP subunit
MLRRFPLRTLAPAMLALLLLAALLLPAACEREQGAQGAMTEAKQPAAAAPAQAQVKAQAAASPAGPGSRTVVEVQTVEAQDFTVSTTYIGYLLPQERVQLRSEIEGLVEHVLFDEGQAVKRGQLLANVSTEQLQVRRDQAKADLALASSNFERDRSLHAKHLVTDAQLEQTSTRRELADYALRLAELELKKSRVTSPLNGTVKTRGVERGEYVNKGQLIAEILDVARLKALFNVPEREVRFLQVGHAVDVTFEALPGERDPGVVRLVGLEADVKTRTFPVEVAIDNARGRLRPGMLARVQVALEHHANQLLVPRYAVLERELGRVVYVVQDGTARERKIETGASSEGQVQVLKGLEPGDQLVVVGQQKLTPGEPVLVRPSQR